ncbi:RNA ligase (TIGR02306 family) [Prosthecobacter fusiformis]|uniref:RNA ligase (TIGR02306 family) n=1 Tax=Prosthecobacter fusiformis TaxID=48464 RepID=A0A4R7RYY8_9BACT|nr:RNA ligase (ATP) [Prosthecobacter fusiformis]TDU71164.1 RNA ligase (TIGR02306 family) [Prosthecobacter fusiformis]
MKRKLASIQSVIAIEPIPNADAIELARIQGWQCVIKKGELRAGDLGVFLEIDSIPPDDPRFTFLWHNKKDVESTERPAAFRLKTVRLRGMLSQGLLLPIQQFPELIRPFVTGTDVTEILGVTKWEPPLPEMEDIAGPFLPGVPKTDEMRVQSVPSVLDELAGRAYVMTLKCDGTSATFGIHQDTGEFTACGRNWSIKRGSNTYWRVAETYHLEKSLQAHPHLAIQGELVGPGIQKNRLGLNCPQFRVFNVYDQQTCCFLGHDEAVAFLNEIKVPMVDVIEEGLSFDHDMESLLALAEGYYPGTQNEREGLVIRPKTEYQSPTLGGRLSFKVISNRFLLKGGD